ncbi:alpha-amylase-like [Homarus americanus]|uniref:alpha-amylase-like n=1 Tax=Homarus americanus TaxID=6706 RepID=UPI001C48BD96|nr:alpha-amylase-like [Homarus americanus]
MMTSAPHLYKANLVTLGATRHPATTMRGLLLVLVVVVGVVRAVYDTPSCADGRQTIVHLFEWKWTDIAQECERFLADAGFCAVQVSPPMEHAVVEENGYPWWQRYQPVSYKLESRSGNRQQFIDMVQRCNAVGVRIIVDAVVNHMTGLGRSGQGSGGSSFNADNRDFPGVPYSSLDFTPRSMCPSADGNINNYNDVNEVRNCYLVGLTDLYGAKDYVRQMISGYYNDLVEIGVMGFRVDAAKHMWPKDLEAIQGLTHDLNTNAGFPSGQRPFFFHEVIDQGGEPITVDQYFSVGRTTEFRFGKKIAWGINDFSQLANIYDPGWGMAPSDKALVFVDNHDNQRGHGGAGDIITFKQPKEYKMGVSFSLAHDYGFMRIMSSYYFDDSDQGPPGSNNGGSTDDVPINADGSCGGGWVCEHRWNPITQMVKFRNAVAGTQMANWYQEGDNVAFSRGDKGFFAMSKYGSFDKTLQTGLPAGQYCELISHCANKVTVNGDGTARIIINNSEEPIFAICAGCDGVEPTVSPDHTTTPHPTLPPIDGMARTVVFVHKQTSVGQDLFIRGGIDSAHRQGCNDNAETDVCAIDITVSSLGTADHYAKYNAWRQGDTKLDWYGAQASQGSYQGQSASGSPLAWTTNKPGAAGYQELNTFGEHYWMVDMMMNCDETEGGWFDLKAFVSNAGTGWESDINQVSSCTGDAGGAKPYTSKNHLGRCGYLNVFDFSGSSCQINSLS